MKSKLWGSILCSCFLFVAWGQDDTRAPQIPAPAQQPAPAKPAAQKDFERDGGGDYFSIEPFYWMNSHAPIVQLGQSSRDLRLSSSGTFTGGQTTPGNLDFPGDPKYAAGATITVPTGKENNLQLTFFQMRGHGNETAEQNLILFGYAFPKGNFLHTTYKVRDFKLSWNYLTYPNPSAGAKLRIKTLWEVQYIIVNSTVNTPYETDTTAVLGRKTLFLPTLGVGLEYHPSKRLRLELKGSGFGWLHKWDIWDTEGSLVYRAGHFEAMAGGKAFHFKTSPKSDQYYSETLMGPYVGVRYIWR